MLKGLRHAAVVRNDCLPSSPMSNGPAGQETACPKKHVLSIYKFQFIIKTFILKKQYPVKNASQILYNYLVLSRN